MSATVIEELVIRLGFQPSPSARNALRDFEVGLQGLVTAATAAVAALGALTIQQAYAGDEAAKTARALGVTVEEYSRIAAAAAGSGVQIEDLRTGMASLTRQLDAAGQAGSPSPRRSRSSGLRSATPRATSDPRPTSSRSWRTRSTGPTSAAATAR